MSISPPIRFSHSRMRWLNPFFRLMLKRRLHAVLVRGALERSEDGLLVLLVQHVGRYDGFVMLQLHAIQARTSTGRASRPNQTYRSPSWCTR